MEMDWSSGQFHALGPCRKLLGLLALPFLLGCSALVAGATLLGVATKQLRSTGWIGTLPAALAAFRNTAASRLAAMVMSTSGERFAFLAALRR